MVEPRFDVAAFPDSPASTLGVALNAIVFALRMLRPIERKAVTRHHESQCSSSFILYRSCFHDRYTAAAFQSYAACRAGRTASSSTTVLDAVSQVRQVTAPLASYLYSRLAGFPTPGARAFHLRSCLLPCSLDFGKEREVTRRCGPMLLRESNTSQAVLPPYSSTEVARAIGVSMDTFYRTRHIRHERDGLPAPISERGPLKWERTGFDAWLTRHHPMRPMTTANDTFLPPPAATDEEHRERLRTAYGRRGA